MIRNLGLFFNKLYWSTRKGKKKMKYLEMTVLVRHTENVIDVNSTVFVMQYNTYNTIYLYTCQII